MRIPHRGRGVAAVAVTLALICPAVATTAWSSAAPAAASEDEAPLALVPRPVSLERGPGSGFRLGPTSVIVAPDDAAPVGEYLADLLRPSTGFSLPVSDVSAATGAITLTLTDAASTDPEGYDLTVSEGAVAIDAPTAAGLFHGVQSLRQLLPAAVEATQVQDADWVVPAVTIEDEPRFEYRSAMLDVARRFYPVDAVKRYIDQIALYKLNTLHLHLTDDQGWRIAIDGLPALTEIGASTQSGWAPGSNTGDPWFYTPADYAEIVEYAASRYIEVVPEIDGPGHTLAAQASVPGLTCDGVPTAPYYGFDVNLPMVCATEANSANIRDYLEKVISSVAAQNPGQYIHLGGDEVPNPPAGWYEAYTAMANEIATEHGKTIVGWHQWAQGATLPAGSLVQYWAEGRVNRPKIGVGAESADIREVRAALAAGARVVVSPADRSYTDMKYSSSTAYGLSWAGLVNLRRAYDWDPVTELSSTDGTVKVVTEEQVAGVEASLWADRAYRGSTSLPTSHSQFIPVEQYTDHMIFPRMPAIAEIAWSPAQDKDYTEFLSRLTQHDDRWDALGYEWFRAPDVEWEPVVPVEPELVHHWAFDETSGQSALDVVTGVRAAVDGGTWTPGQLGGAVSLDGVDDGVALSAAPVSGPWTVASWVRRTGARSSSALLSDTSSGVRTAIKLEQYKATAKVGFTQLGVADHRSEYATPLDEWVHLTLVSDGATITVYADGAQVSTVPGTATLGLAQLGRLMNAPGWPGASDAAAVDVDDLRVYTGALDRAAVGALWDEVSPAPATVEVDTTTRCVAGRVVISVRAVNVGDVAVDLQVVTAAGKKSFSAVAPGAGAHQSFATRAVDIPAGEVTVTATGDTGSGPISTEIVTGYEAAGCS